jgi:hypothetical protein
MKRKAVTFCDTLPPLERPIEGSVNLMAVNAAGRAKCYCSNAEDSMIARLVERPGDGDSPEQRHRETGGKEIS